MARISLAMVLLVAAALTPSGQASSLRGRRIHARNQPPSDSFRKNFGWPGFSFPMDRWGVVIDSPEVEEAAAEAATATIVPPNLGTVPVNIAPSPASVYGSTPIFSALSIVSSVPPAVPTLSSAPSDISVSNSSSGLSNNSESNSTSSSVTSFSSVPVPEVSSASQPQATVSSSESSSSSVVPNPSPSSAKSVHSQAPIPTPVPSHTSQPAVPPVIVSSAPSHSAAAAAPLAPPVPSVHSSPPPPPPAPTHSQAPQPSQPAPQPPAPVNVGTNPNQSSNQGQTSSSNSNSNSGSGSGSTSGPTSPSDIQAYLSAHNTVRAQHGASPLTYSQSLAAKAQQWANGCVFQHSGGSLGPFGENLAAGTGSGYGISQAIGSWTAEVSQYNPNNPVPSHFTQVVWKSTTEVGCALQNCAGIFPSSFGLAHYYVCEYSPQGNIIGEFAANVQV